MGISPADHLLSKIILTNLGFVFINEILDFILFCFCNLCVDTVVGITLNLLIYFGRMASLCLNRDRIYSSHIHFINKNQKKSFTVF